MCFRSDPHPLCRNGRAIAVRQVSRLIEPALESYWCHSSRANEWIIRVMWRTRLKKKKPCMIYCTSSWSQKKIVRQFNIHDLVMTFVRDDSNFWSLLTTQNVRLKTWQSCHHIQEKWRKFATRQPSSFDKVSRIHSFTGIGIKLPWHTPGATTNLPAGKRKSLILTYWGQSTRIRTFCQSADPGTWLIRPK